MLLRLGNYLSKKLCFQKKVEELLALVRKRINDPKEMFEEVTLDDL